MNVSHTTIAGDGVQLHVARAGEGPPVILLHGFPEHWRSWRHQIEALAAAGFSVWAPDLRGYHASAKPAARSAYQIEHLVEDVAAIVRATGQPRAHVIGHDWGGIIAWSFAARYPELLDRLVIVNAPHMRVYMRLLFRTRQIFWSWYVLFFQLPWLPELALSAFDHWLIRRMFRQVPRNAFPPDEIQHLVEALAQPGSLTAALNFYRANFLHAERALASAAIIPSPTLVIWGEQDPFLVVELLDGLAEFVPRLTIHRIADAGHWVQNERPDEVSRAIVKFLSSGADADQ